MNRLLGNLNTDACQSLLSHYKLVNLALSDVLNREGDTIEYVYFPFLGVISLVVPNREKSTIGVSLVGNEGMIGATLMLGVNTSPFRAVVQSCGTALQIPRREFFKEVSNNTALKCKLERYLYVILSQLIQSSGCHRYHLVEERLARLLLMMSDRLNSNVLYITQDMLAKTLGVRRVGVSKAACSLKDRNLIIYNRGQVFIHDTHELEKASCSCYQIDNNIYERILGGQDQFI